MNKNLNDPKWIRWLAAEWCEARAGLYLDLQITHEEEEEIIKKAAEMIHKVDMDVAAIMMLETYKPLAYIGGQMGRFFISPFLLILGKDIGLRGEKFMRIFEKGENLEKLIVLLEEMAKEEDKQKEESKKTKEAQKAETKGTPPKKGWRRFLPF